MSEPAASPAPAKPVEKPAPKKREVKRNPVADLVPRRQDVFLPPEKLIAFRDSVELLRARKPEVSVDKFAGALVLRRYYAGDVICRQGEAGNSAYYIATVEDEQRLRAATVIDASRSLSDIDLGGDEVLSVHLAIAKKAEDGRGWLRRRLDSIGGQKARAAHRPKYIPIDAPVNVDYESRKASLRAGELFGEMSCLYRTPRSATVIAERDCYVVEMLRNVLDQCKRDPAFKKSMDDKYRERVLGLQLLGLPLFQNLDPAFVQNWVQNEPGIQLTSYRGGDIICDENDHPDFMFIIRSGVVKVSRGVTALYGRADVRDWAALAAAILAAPPGSRLADVRDAIPEAADANFPATVADRRAYPHARAGVLQGLNSAIKSARVTLAGSSEAEARRANRRALDRELGHAVRPLPAPEDPDDPGSGEPEVVLTYLGKGELVGEMGVVSGKPRSATCVPASHRRYGEALETVKSTDEEIVELVQIPARTFLDLLARPEAAPLKAFVDREIHKRRVAERDEAAADEGPRRRKFSEEFERLSLVQGQKLMLIDLDRCTRCDECVRACVASHDDGRSRLFLEGPRFEHYLVPLTCRSCLDPVCLIGCPVGSIRRGDNREIRIEDWCIGCGQCADQCPYGSIQMHDIGLIPAGAVGWQFRPDPDEALIGKHPSRGGAEALAAVRAVAEGELRVSKAELAAKRKEALKAAAVEIETDSDAGDNTLQQARDALAKEQAAAGVAIARWMAAHERQLDWRGATVPCFRGRDFAAAAGAGSFWCSYTFDVPADLLKGDHVFDLSLVGPDPAAVVVINGREIPTPERYKNNTNSRAFPMGDAKDVLKAKGNRILVRMSPAKEFTKEVFDLRLDATPKPEEIKVAKGSQFEIVEYSIKTVESRAVVCDMCSDSWRQVPACVNACPHDAAMRVDARRNFPPG